MLQQENYFSFTQFQGASGEITIGALSSSKSPFNIMPNKNLNTKDSGLMLLEKARANSLAPVGSTVTLREADFSEKHATVLHTDIQSE